MQLTQITSSQADNLSCLVDATHHNLTIKTENNIDTRSAGVKRKSVKNSLILLIDPSSESTIVIVVKS